MGDDIQYGNGRGPAPRRRMYAAPFGALQTDAPSIQYGNGQTGPAQGGSGGLVAAGGISLAGGGYTCGHSQQVNNDGSALMYPMSNGTWP
jgi:hypothetical protein